MVGECLAVIEQVGEALVAVKGSGGSSGGGLIVIGDEAGVVEAVDNAGGSADRSARAHFCSHSVPRLGTGGAPPLPLDEEAGEEVEVGAMEQELGERHGGEAEKDGDCGVLVFSMVVPWMG